MPLRNPDLDVDAQRLARWNAPDRRRQSFRNLHLIHRRGSSFRSPEVWPLALRPDPLPAVAPGLRRLTDQPAFCALTVAQADRIVFERYAEDFGPRRLHSIQSITKTFVHLAMGRLVADGLVDPGRPIGDYVPEAGSAYAAASVQQALDMDVCSNFSEDYAAPYTPCPAPGEPVGYARQEIAMGWRLPPEGEAEFGVRAFASGLVKLPRQGHGRETLYTSPNTDMLGWVIERASGRGLSEHVEAIVEAAGLEDAFHISVDCEGVPVLSGGGVMTPRDLVRYGLLIARSGAGLVGPTVGSAAFLADTLTGPGTRYSGPDNLRYRNHMLTNGRWVGHPGYAGQFLMIDPAKQAAAAFFSVLETPYGDREGYFQEIMTSLGIVLARLP
ncbi:serine hydrolase domain-containing protein [Aestuariivirga sp.]|uniref:serine hydrolase domain-containing protein n=1 Tax=Aestuariivirga sp. TaxID=2650926 RepID=UPI00391CB1AD